VAEHERTVTSFQNDLNKLLNFVQEKYTYLSELEDSMDKRSSKLKRLSECIESSNANILRMRHIVDNQSITLEEKKQAEQEYRELEESTEIDRACCDAYLKSVYADDLQIAKLRSESRANNVVYSATLIEYSYMVLELNISVNLLHKDADQTMQNILNQLYNIRAQLKTQLHEMENELEENEKRERRALELKFAAIEECNSVARRVEEIDIGKLKEETKQEKQRLKQELKRV